MTVYNNIGSYRRPPPLFRLVTGIGAELHGCAMGSAEWGLPVAEFKRGSPWMLKRRREERKEKEGRDSRKEIWD